jgi:hypothetical protein
MWLTSDASIDWPGTARKINEQINRRCASQRPTINLAVVPCRCSRSESTTPAPVEKIPKAGVQRAKTTLTRTTHLQSIMIPIRPRVLTGAICPSSLNWIHISIFEESFRNKRACQCQYVMNDPSCCVAVDDHSQLKTVRYLFYWAALLMRLHPIEGWEPRRSYHWLIFIPSLTPGAAKLSPRDRCHQPCNA